MTGYQEILTDPSYSGQIINMTYPQIGNYGINKDDIESNKIQCSGFIVKQASDFPSNYRSSSSLDEYLESNRVVGIQNVDTRMITRMIRDQGAMNAVISSSELSNESIQNHLDKIPDMSGLDLAKKVTCSDSYQLERPSDARHKVAAIDFGIKSNILRILSNLKCDIKVVEVADAP